MIPSECGQLLRACSFYDNRKVSEEAMVAWSKAISSEVTVADGLQAVIDHHAATDKWCAPSHINNLVNTVRRERLQRAGIPPMPPNLEREQENAWRKLWCSTVKDGEDASTAARIASEAMCLPLELPPADGDWQAEKLALIQKLAQSKSIPKIEGRKRRRVEYVDDTGSAAS